MKKLQPDDLKVGQYIVVLEYLPYVEIAQEMNLGDEVRTMNVSRLRGLPNGLPMRIINVDLPFVVCHDRGTTIIDTRTTVLARPSQEYVDAVFYGLT